MRLDKKQRRLVAVLILGGAAVFTDRVLLGGGQGPAQASAGVLPAEESLAHAPGAPHAAAATVPASANMQSVAERLNTLRDSLGDLGPAAEAFSVPASWKHPKPGAAAEQAAVAVASASADEFTQKYSVRSITRLREGESRVVLSDGRMIKEGEIVDNAWRLQSVSHHDEGGPLTALFVAIGGGASVNLAAPTPTMAGLKLTAPR